MENLCLLLHCQEVEMFCKSGTGTSTVFTRRLHGSAEDLRRVRVKGQNARQDEGINYGSRRRSWGARRADNSISWRKKERVIWKSGAAPGRSRPSEKTWQDASRNRPWEPIYERNRVQQWARGEIRVERETEGKLPSDSICDSLPMPYRQMATSGESLLDIGIKFLPFCRNTTVTWEISRTSLFEVWDNT